MSSGEARPHGEMLGLAVEVVKLLAPHCTRIAIGGSLRRGTKATVGDIEIICQPAEQNLPSGRKGFIQIKQNAVNWKCDRLREDKIFEARLNMSGHIEAWADRHKRAWYKGAKLDLFMVLPDRSWGWTMCLRTGPSDANQVLVTREGVLNQDGNRGILQPPFVFREGELWYGDVHVPTPEESDVFAALGLPYIPAPLRTVGMYQQWAARRDNRRTPTAWVQQYGEPGRSTVGTQIIRGDEVWLGGQPRYLNTKVGAEEQIAS